MKILQTLTVGMISLVPERMYGYLEISFFRILFITQTYIKKCVLITQLFFNNELRERALNKIRIHYRHKTLLNYIYQMVKIDKRPAFFNGYFYKIKRI